VITSINHIRNRGMGETPMLRSGNITRMTVQDAPHAPAMSPTLAYEPAAEAAPVGSRRRERLVSLDVFRGITIAAMLLVNNPGKGRAYAPLEHADWNGWTPTDLIFPFFLFIVGVAIPFSMSKRAMRLGKMELLGGIWFRALCIMLCGALLHALPTAAMDPLPKGFVTLWVLRWVAVMFTVGGLFAVLYPMKRSPHWKWIIPGIGLGLVLLLVGIHFANRHALASGIGDSFKFGGGAMLPYKYRIPGVLQRIGVCYGVAATIALFAGWRTVLAAAVILMAVYSGLMLRAPFENHQVGSLTHNDNLARRIDEKVFRNHNYGQYPDPEGLLSTLPAVGSVLLGILCGYWLRTQRAPMERGAGLLAMGVVVTVVGVLLDWWLMPINKQIWTPSFTVFTAGLGMLTLGAIFWIVDVQGWKWWTWPWVVYGMNAIAAFVAASLGARLLNMVKTRAWDGRELGLGTIMRDRAAEGVHWVGQWWPAIDTPGMTSLAGALCFVLMIWVVMCVLYLFKVFIKV
jgi:predicted acyltransferase